MNPGSDSPTLLSIAEIFGGQGNYVVPMYQRNYSWGEAEIGQLVQDVVDAMGVQADSNYYLGTLVTFPRPQADGTYWYELIDGQQRFTTLMLMLIYLEKNGARADINISRNARLQFECRETSTHALAEIRNAPAVRYGTRDTARVIDETGGHSIYEGYRLLESEFRKQLGEKDDPRLREFYTYFLSRVKLLRVEVPPHTDVNHYFEIMNNRGEQLEKHEVLKARLLSDLDPIPASDNRPSEQAVFNRIWEACSDMSRYVQMAFSPDERGRLFGDEWTGFNPSNFAGIADEISGRDASGAEHCNAVGSLDALIDASGEPSRPTTDDADRSERFHSVIDFPNFLLHVLRVTRRQTIVAGGAKQAGMIPLDDKRLIPVFEKNLLNADLVKQFGFDLLRCRYLFDQYVIKRETTAKGDGWSLQYCYKYVHNRNARSNYKNTFGGDRDGDVQDRILMLQAALHVSAPTRPYKYWLSGTLDFLARRAPGSDGIDGFGEKLYDALQSMAQAFVFNRYLSDAPAEYDDIIYKRNDAHIPRLSERKVVDRHLLYGDIKNNLVFNYLDFLLWKDGWGTATPAQRPEFQFTQRSSVEHMQPQTSYVASHGKAWGDAVNEFGNLCLISRNQNSSLTNRSPKEKADKIIDAGVDSAVSLKQFVMAQLIRAANGDWSVAQMRQHGKEMVNLLCDSVNQKDERG